MIDIIGLIIGVVIFVAGGFAGASIHAQVITAKQPLAHLDNPNQCGCNHHKSFHKDDLNCNARDRWGNPCRCTIFVPKYPLDPFLEAAKKELTSGEMPE